MRPIISPQIFRAVLARGRTLPRTKLSILANCNESRSASEANTNRCRFCLRYAICPSIREDAGSATKLLFAWKFGDEKLFRAVRAVDGFRSRGAASAKAAFNAVKFGMKGAMHRLKIGDLIIPFLAVNVVDMEACRNWSAMHFPHSAMQVDSPFRDSIPSDVISVLASPPPLPAPCHGWGMFGVALFSPINNRWSPGRTFSARTNSFVELSQMGWLAVHFRTVLSV